MPLAAANPGSTRAGDAQSKTVERPETFATPFARTSLRACHPWRVPSFIRARSVVFALGLAASAWLVADLTYSADAPAAEKAEVLTGPPITAAGVVVDTAGKPIAGATVYLREWSLQRFSENTRELNQQDVLATTQTDERGEFAFRQAPSRAFRYREPSKAPWDVLAVAPGCGMAGLHLLAAVEPRRLEIVLAPEASLTGRVVDDQGRPLADTLVKANIISALDAPYTGAYNEPRTLYFGFSRLAPRTRTDADGWFRLPGLARANRVSLEFDHPTCVRKWVVAATAEGPQPDIVLQGAASRTTILGDPIKVHTGELAVTLEKGWQLSGRVTLEGTGEPAAGAWLSPQRPNGNWATYGEAADADGRFLFTGLSLPRYRLTISPRDATDHVGRDIDVELPEERGLMRLDVTLPRAVAVTGSVVDEDTGRGIAGVNVGEPYLLSTLPIHSRPVTTDDLGRFRIALPAGKRTLHITGPIADYSLPPRPALAEPLPTDERFTRTLEVIAGQPPAELRFAVNHGLTVTAIVSDPDGRPLDGAEVWGVDQHIQPLEHRSARTDERGRFRMAGFPTAEARTLFVVHRERRLRGRLEIPALPEGDRRQTRPVATTVRLQPAGRVVGRVTDGTVPLVGVRIWLSEIFQVPTGDLHAVVTAGTDIHALTDAEGKFALDLVEPRRTLVLTAPEESLQRGALNVKAFTIEPGATFEHPAIVIRRAP